MALKHTTVSPEFPKAAERGETYRVCARLKACYNYMLKCVPDPLLLILSRRKEVMITGIQLFIDSTT